MSHYWIERTEIKFLEQYLLKDIVNEIYDYFLYQVEQPLRITYWDINWWSGHSLCEDFGIISKVLKKFELYQIHSETHGIFYANMSDLFSYSRGGIKCHISNTKIDKEKLYKGGSILIGGF
jgi:hypothetical protein